MDSRLSVQRSAKGQILINLRQKLVCSGQPGLLYMHFNSARMQPDRSYTTGTNMNNCAEVCINICIHAYTRTLGCLETTECC